MPEQICFSIKANKTVSTMLLVAVSALSSLAPAHAQAANAGEIEDAIFAVIETDTTTSS